MEVYINSGCILCGLCEDTCPEVFRLGEETAEVIAEEILPEYEAACREAAETCPTDAIEIN